MEKSNFEREVLDRLIVLETLLKQQDYKGLSEKVELDHEKIIKDEQITEDHEKRITKIEDNNKWLWRTIAATLLAAALSIIFNIA